MAKDSLARRVNVGIQIRYLSKLSTNYPDIESYIDHLEDEISRAKVKLDLMEQELKEAIVENKTGQTLQDVYGIAKEKDTPTTPEKENVV